MKSLLNFRYSILVLFYIFLNNSTHQDTYAQNTKNNIVRLNVTYVKIMKGDMFFDIKATSKIDKKSVGIANINLDIYNEIDSSESILLGKTTTNLNGEGKFILDNINAIKTDSTNFYNIKILFKGNDSFKKASKYFSFKNADINSKLITKDSINYISATLIDRTNDSPIEGEPLTVQVQRLFKPLKLGKELNFTNENGSIVVPIEEGIPGVDEILTFEIVLTDHDDFGTIKALIKAPIGIPIVEESTFNERTMWSPRNKTPIFLLIIPNILTFGIWGFIIYLIVNLFKIQKT
ncbi:hypothetical protein [Lutibacter flavus]|uniref:Oxygen tolerance n=1 Tax=Lutibacter flavus TaxID=691689 RepID=A0A238XT21_9FLAO|nr:hypothetical protein [Lutibacter flavus]SNR61870.1 hypothetical protein SAMN04488111_2080 [Lutibacter flavus]